MHPGVPAAGRGTQLVTPGLIFDAVATTTPRGWVWRRYWQGLTMTTAAMVNFAYNQIDQARKELNAVSN